MPIHYALLLAAVVLALQTRLAAEPASGGSQGTRKDDPAFKDASQTFGKLTLLAESGALFPASSTSGREGDALAMMEALIAPSHLTLETRLRPPGTGGVWTGQDDSGIVVLKIMAPWLGDKTTNYAEVAYAPVNPTPIQPAVLSHILSKAENTTVSGGDTILLQFAFEKTSAAQGKDACSSRTTTTIRLSGELVETSRSTWCDVGKR